MPYSWIGIDEWPFFAPLSYSALNQLRENQEELYNSYGVEHDFASGIHQLIRMASGNLADTPAPDPRGGALISFKKSIAPPAYVAATATFEEVVIDDSLDWRDRKVLIVAIGILSNTLAKAEAFLDGADKYVKSWWSHCLDTEGWSAGGGVSQQKPLEDEVGLGNANSANYVIAAGYTDQGYPDATDYHANYRLHVQLAFDPGNNYPPGDEHVFLSLFIAGDHAGELRLQFMRLAGADDHTGWGGAVVGVAFAFPKENNY